MRKLTTILLLLFIHCSVSATEIEFTDTLKNYTFKVDEYGVEYKSSFSSFMIWESQCNKTYIDSLKKLLKKKMRSWSVSSDVKKSFQVTINGNLFSLYKKSPTAQFLFDLDRYVMDLRLKERTHCE
jgi:hypothetical protein